MSDSLPGGIIEIKHLVKLMRKHRSAVLVKNRDRYTVILPHVGEVEIKDVADADEILSNPFLETG